MIASVLLLKISLGLLLLWLFSFVLWRDYRLDAFREAIFELRDNLFLFAAEGGISFENAAYRMLRHRMNVTLRFAHFFTLSRFATVSVLLDRFPDPKREHAEWQKALDSVPSVEARNTLKTFSDGVTFAVLEYALMRSFFLFLFTIPLRIAGYMKRKMERPPRRAERTAEELQIRALEEDLAQTRNRPAVAIATR